MPLLASMVSNEKCAVIQVDFFPTVNIYFIFCCFQDFFVLSLQKFYQDVPWCGFSWGLYCLKYTHVLEYVGLYFCQILNIFGHYLFKYFSALLSFSFFSGIPMI